MQRITRVGLCAGIIALALSAFASPAYAADSGTGPNDGEVKMFVKIDGQLVEADEIIAETDIDLSQPASEEPGQISPQLIGWDQWYGCFVLNNQNDIFVEYTHYWNGIAHDVNLKCGTSGWGYKHIQEGHQQDWQNKYDNAVSVGWNPASQGIHSWDDLLAAATGVAVTWPDYVRDNTINQTRCGVAEAFFINTQTGAIEYSFPTRAAWALNSDRLITAFPQSGYTC